MMKKVLYVTNIEVPYRVRFFNQLAEHCDLTVLYGREKGAQRNGKWSKSQSISHKALYLKGFKLGLEDTFSFGILKHVFSKQYDAVVLGCYNSPTQMLAILAMRLFRKPYILNIDGEVFVGEKGFKNKLKKFFLSGASHYVAAGEKSAESLKAIVKNKPITSYYFSSMSEEELKHNANIGCNPGQTVLVVGQYLDVKGIDVALEAAKMDDSFQYKFIGMGAQTQEFIEKYQAASVKNVEFIPFLQKQDLEKEYQTCGVFVLPSRQECWGLVVNEAASFGTPIVSTWGSGAGVEFLADEYPCYLANPGDHKDLYQKIKAALLDENKEEYGRFLLEKSKKYSIEQAVEAHCRVLEIGE